jgi:hypothetical protein
MMANGFDISESFTMDKSQAEEIVPVADPGIETRMVSIRYKRRPVANGVDDESAWAASTGRTTHVGWTGGAGDTSEQSGRDVAKRQSGQPAREEEVDVTDGSAGHAGFAGQSSVLGTGTEGDTELI